MTDASWFEGWRVVGSSAGVWVQPYPAGPVARITEEGLDHAHYSAGTRLQLATEAGAWCGPQLPAQDLADTAHTPPRRRLIATDVLLARPEGALARVTVDRPVRGLRAGPEGEGVYACVELDPWQRHHLGADTWQLVRERTWIAVPPPQSSHERRRVADWPSEQAPEPPAWPTHRFPGPGSPWHAPPSGKQPGVLAGGLWWALGWDQARLSEQGVIATGHEPHSNAEQQRVELGAGKVLAAAVMDSWLWVAIRRARWVSPYVGGPVELCRIDTRHGCVETLLPADSVEITDGCWPLPPQPVDADSYAEYQRTTVTGLDDAERSSSGSPAAMGAGIRHSAAELVGAWPQTAVRLSFAYDPLPGLRLVRMLPIFDELGRQRPLQYAGIHLLEDLDTGKLPPASQARNGILEI